jgi:hypothetical protein
MEFQNLQSIGAYVDMKVIVYVWCDQLARRDKSSLYGKLGVLLSGLQEVARSLALEAEAFLNARHQLNDTKASVDLDGVEMQRRSFFEHLFRIDRITRK